MNGKETGFLMYSRWERQFERLEMEQRGMLITAIFKFYRSGQLPDCEDAEVGMALDFIAEQISYDKQKYAEKCEKNRCNGAKSHGEKETREPCGEELKANGTERKRTVANGTERKRTVANGTERKRTVANGTISDTDTDSDSDTDSKRERNARAHEARGKYSNVFLTDAEYGELRQELPGLDKLIERLSSYMQATGKGYDDHAAALRLWGERARDIHAQTERSGERDGGGFDTDEFFTAALERGSKYGSIEETANAPPAWQNTL